MAQETVDLADATRILRKAIGAAKAPGYTPTHPNADLIKQVMLGTHLTYRYILITNLLAKATNPAVNAIALQAGANFSGAFDSRSLCHGVIVPSDRNPDELAGKLGRSNEPYLNKPARFAALTRDNAVRKGYDKDIRDMSIEVLAGLTTQDDAYLALQDAIHFVLLRDSLVAKVSQFSGDASLHKMLVKFSTALTSESMEGQSCAILTGLAFHIFSRGQNWTATIKVHPVNQAGTSSNEVLDVDIFRVDASGTQRLYRAAEVKDKTFEFQDVDHAAAKAIDAGLSGFFFICGPNSQGASAGIEHVDAIAEKGIKVNFIDIEQLFHMALGLAPEDMSQDEIWTYVDNAMREARVKDDTRQHVFNCARQAGIISDD